MIPSYEETISALSIPEDELNRLNSKNRKKLKLAVNWFWISTAVAVVVCYIAYGVYDSGSWLPWLTIVLWLFCLCWIIFRSYANKHAYTLAFKRSVVGPLADTMLKLAELPNETKGYEKYCHYNPEAYISKKWIDTSELFDTRIDDIKGEDLFHGKYGLTEFEFSELKMTKEDSSTDSDGTTTTTTITVFDGVLFVADFKKHFSGLTVIEKKLIKSDRGIGKLAGKLFNRAGSTANRRANIQIELESAAFNRNFIVQTTDEIEARYILSSSMMEQILSFVTNHPNPLTISFHNSYMFIAVSSTKNFFDDGIGGKKSGYNLEGIYNDLATFFRIIEEFDLNTRIWSKK